jgi:hypothetical protein
MFKGFLKFIMFFSLGIPLAYAKLNDSWQFEVAPYIWALNMNGRVQTGPIKMHINEPFTDILSQFNYGGMIWVDARKEKFDIFFNGLYSVLSNSVKDGPVTIDSHNIFALYTFGVAYELFKKDFSHVDPNYVTIEPYFGARYTRNDVTLKVARLNLTVSNNQNWTDPIIGARLNYVFNRHWRAIVAGDVGGTNTSSHNSYNINAVVGYTPLSFPCARVYAGYRWLYQHYITGSGLKRFDWDMKIYGPMVGVGLVF